MIGTAPIGSICYGFSEIKEDALMLSGEGDIGSTGVSFVSKAGHSERYYTPDPQINNTQKYNEMDIRRIQNGKKLQPSYIVVFRRNGAIPNMEEAKRASEQWEGLPIVIVDVDKCLEEQRKTVEEMLEDYRKSPSKEAAKEIAQKVRNNRVTSREFCLDLENELEDIRKAVREKEQEQYTAQEEKIEKQTIGEEQLEENYGTVSAVERKKEASKIREVYAKIKDKVKEENSEQR